MPQQAFSSESNAARNARFQDLTAAPLAMPNRANSHVIGLDVVRVMAALLVVWVHYGIFSWQRAYSTRAIPGHHFFASGWIGVEIFFVLSGFVIAYSARAATAASFLRNRLARLWPAMLFCATLAAFMQRIDHQILGQRDFFTCWSSSVFFLPGAKYIDPSHWTLAIEIQFYLVIFALLLFGKLPKLMTVLSVLGTASTIFCGVVWMSLLPGHAHLVLVNTITGNLLQSWTALLYHFCYFALGMMLSSAFEQGFTPRHMIFLSIFTAGGLMEIAARKIQLASTFNASYLLSATLWLTSLACIYVAVRWNARLLLLAGPRGALIWRRLGLMTYPLYLIHQSVGHFVMYFAARHIGEIPALWLALVVAVVLSYLVATYVEPPMTRWLRTFLKSAPAEGDVQRESLQQGALPSA